MRPAFLFSPHVMGAFSPARSALARDTWRRVQPALPDAVPVERMGALCRALADEVAAVRAAGDLPVVLVGDCTASIGVLAGLQRDAPDLTLVWYDAHGDFNTHQTTPSGFIGGMPLAMLCGRGEQTIVHAAGARVHPERQVVLTDARDLDPDEMGAVAGSEMTHLPDVADLLQLDLPEGPLYVHFDSDVLRLDDLSAVNFPAAGGAPLETIEASLARLAATGRVVAVSVTMWNPDKDGAGGAERVVMGLVDRLVGRLASV